DPAGDLAGGGIDARDVIVLPDVGVDDPAVALELVEVAHGRALAPHRHLAPTHFGEGLGVAEEEAIATVAHHQALAVEAEPPPFALVRHLALLLERGQIPQERAPVLPRDLPEPAA